MGMFDSIVCLDETLLPSADGRYIREFQTKNLECTCSYYYIKDRQFYEVSAETGEFVEQVKDFLYMTSRTALKPMKFDRTMRVYTDDSESQPVLSFAAKKSWGSGIDEWHPWVEYTLFVRDGKIIDVEASRVESRADVRKRLKSEGLFVLEDSDAIAQAHFAAEMRTKREDLLK